LIEQRQIVDRLDCRPMISLTDHDSIDAPLMLRALSKSRDVPVSAEWTVPFHNTFFHVGVHNLPPNKARTLFHEMNGYASDPKPERLTELLAGLNEDPGVLCVLNHPLWDERGIGQSAHRTVVEDLLHRNGRFLHAFELNGFRPAAENDRVAELAVAFHRPVISGGDRHGREPNANLNLTNAATFPEFVSEVREDRRSVVLWMPQSRERRSVRYLRVLGDIVRDDPHHGLGWTRWNERFFYRCDDGVVRSLSAIWGDGSAPLVMNRIVTAVQLLDRARLKWVQTLPDVSPEAEPHIRPRAYRLEQLFPKELVMRKARNSRSRSMRLNPIPGSARPKRRLWRPSAAPGKPENPRLQNVPEEAEKVAEVATEALESSPDS